MVTSETNNNIWVRENNHEVEQSAFVHNTTQNSTGSLDYLAHIACHFTHHFVQQQTKQNSLLFQSALTWGLFVLFQCTKVNIKFLPTIFEASTGKLQFNVQQIILRFNTPKRFWKLFPAARRQTSHPTKTFTPHLSSAGETARHPECYSDHLQYQNYSLNPLTYTTNRHNYYSSTNLPFQT
jgi:hypothetical protein